MKDDFLYQNRPPVRKEFADGLYKRLQALESSRLEQQKGGISMRPTVLYHQRWKVVMPTLILLSVLALVFAFSEPVRAKTVEVIRVIAGFMVDERSESPLKTLDQGEAVPGQTATVNPIAAPNTIQPVPVQVEPTVYAVSTTFLSDLIDHAPFDFNLPAWVPEGYGIDKTAGIAASSNWVSLVWKNPNRTEIELLVEREYTGYKLPAGENSTEEIKINGAPALLTRGFWDAQHQWDPKRGIALDWEKNGRHYRLNYSERGAAHQEIVPITGNMEKIIEEIVKMAESVP